MSTSAPVRVQLRQGERQGLPVPVLVLAPVQALKLEPLVLVGDPTLLLLERRTGFRAPMSSCNELCWN